MKFNYLLRESQFHGGRRLAEKYFRVWWQVGLVLLFGAAVAVIHETVRRFLEQPTFLAQGEAVTATPHFPSVFVCPEVLFQEHKIEEFLHHIKMPSSLNETYVRSKIYQLAAFFSADVSFDVRDLKNLEHLLEYNEMDLFTAGLLLTATCEETLIRCRWRQVVENCSTLFHMELTGDGYCCVFNGRSLRRGFTEYDEQEYINHFFGFSSGLMLVVNQTQKPVDVDLSYKWLALQTSQHYVESTVNGTPLNPGAEQWASYHIQNFQIEETAKQLSDSLRKCRMGSEHLIFFPEYHRRYCVVECEMHRTLAMCGCVRQVHPRPPGVKYCQAHELSCAARAKVTYDSDACDCPIACDVATDHVKTSSFRLLDSVHPLDTFYDGLNFEKVTIVRAFMQSGAVKTNTRQPYFSNTDLFAQLGGVFNMFFGVSVLTLFELGILFVHWIKSLTVNTVNCDTRDAVADAKVATQKRTEKKNRRLKCTLA